MQSLPKQLKAGKPKTHGKMHDLRTAQLDCNCTLLGRAARESVKDSAMEGSYTPSIN